MIRQGPAAVVAAFAEGPFALGAATLGNLYSEQDEQTCRETVEGAWAAGVRGFDTAPHYGLGLSERRLGESLRERPREHFAISTKVGRLLVPSPETADRRDDAGFAVPADHRRVVDFSRDGVLRSIEQSLERLGIDRVDLVHVHDPDQHLGVAADAAIPTLCELRDEGVIGAVGAGMNAAGPLAWLIERSDLDVVLCAGRITLLDQSGVRELLPVASRRGVAVIAAGVYNSGLLATVAPRPDAPFDYGTAPAAMLRRARELAATCARHGVTLPEAAVAYPRCFPEVSAVLLGAIGLEQIERSAERAAVRVPEGLWAELREAGALDEAPR